MTILPSRKWHMTAIWMENVGIIRKGVNIQYLPSLGGQFKQLQVCV